MTLKKLFIFLLIGSSIFISREIRSDEMPNSFHPYMKGGAFIILPTAGMGLRYQKGHHGCDLSGSYTLAPFAGPLKNLKVLYLYYPFSSKHLYCGVGMGGAWWKGEFERRYQRGVSFEQTIGYEWLSKKFYKDLFYFAQLELSECEFLFQTWAPLPTFTMGIGF